MHTYSVHIYPLKFVHGLFWQKLAAVQTSLIVGLIFIKTRGEIVDGQEERGGAGGQIAMAPDHTML